MTGGFTTGPAPTPQTIGEAGLHHLNIALRCPRCAHRRVLGARGLWWLFHQRRWRDELPQIARRLRCEACFAASGRVVRPEWRVTAEEETGAALPPPDMRAWKRLVARYRN